VQSLHLLSYSDSHVLVEVFDTNTPKPMRVQVVSSCFTDFMFGRFIRHFEVAFKSSRILRRIDW